MSHRVAVLSVSVPGRAAVEGARAMSPHRLHIRPAELFSSDQHAVGIGDSTLVYLAYGGEVELDAVCPDGLLHAASRPARRVRDDD